MRENAKPIQYYEEGDELQAKFGISTLIRFSESKLGQIRIYILSTELTTRRNGKKFNEHELKKVFVSNEGP